MILTINDRIKSRKIEFFNQFEISLSYNSIASSFSFNYFFDPTNKEHVDLSCIGHFHKCTLEHNGELILTGYVISTSFQSSKDEHLVSISGYSLTGVLEDCHVLPTMSLQFDNLTIKEIVSKLIDPFGLEMSIDSSVSSKMNEKIAKTAIEPTQTIKDFLCEICAQKKILVSHNEKGQLLFTEAKTKLNPIIKYDGGGSPFTKMILLYNGQGMHSDITVLKQSNGGNAGQSTIKNPFVPFVYRPKTIIQSSGTDIDTDLAAANALANELKELKLAIEVDRWDIGDKILKPNNVIAIQNPFIYLFNETNWFIESVTLIGDSTKMIAKLDCVIPTVYNSDTPVYIFKGINEHG